MSPETKDAMFDLQRIVEELYGAYLSGKPDSVNAAMCDRSFPSYVIASSGIWKTTMAIKMAVQPKDKDIKVRVSDNS